MRKIKEMELKEILTKEDLINAIRTYRKESNGVVFFDTETTGLNIKYDSPFLIPWGFLNKDNTKHISTV